MAPVAVTGWIDHRGGINCSPEHQLRPCPLPAYFCEHKTLIPVQILL
jgi:hypothetical protein